MRELLWLVPVLPFAGALLNGFLLRNRVGKRALIFAPLMFITIRLLERGEPLAASVFRTVFLLLVFLPFSYVMDSFLYRSYQRRTQSKG